MAIRRVSPGIYTDGRRTVRAESLAEAKKKLTSSPTPKPPTPTPTPNPLPNPPAASRQKLCLDILGGAMYVSESVAAYTRNPALGLGFFWVEFGHAGRLLDSLYNAGCRWVRIQALWRSSHVYGPREETEAVKYAAEIEKLKRTKYQDMEIFFSPFCEHNLVTAKMVSVFAKCSKVAPSLRMVNSPWKGGYVDDDIAINEIHSFDKTPPKGIYFVSGDGVVGAKNDGCGLPDVDMEDWNKRYADAAAKLSWSVRCNLSEAKQPKIPPKSRRAKPLVRDLVSLVPILGPKGTPPSVPGAKPFPVGNPKYIYKSHSEDVYNANQGKPEGSRERKPVVIVPFGGLNKVIQVRDISGKLLAQSTPGTSFTGGGYRYYLPEYGYEFGERAFRSTGSEFVVLQYGNIKLLVNPAFREGTYR